MTKPLAARALRLALALSFAVSLAGCETLDKFNPFGEKETPLPGARQPVFPEGVPGVTYSGPVAQPSNANIAIGAPGGSNAGTPPPGGRTSPGY